MSLAEITSALTFMPSAWSIIAGVMMVTATAVLCILAWRRSGHSRSVGVLELLRFCAVTLIAVLLNQPEWQTLTRPDTRPTIAVLWDDSPSMQTRDASGPAGDVGSPEAVTQDRITRAESIQGLLEKTTWQRLGQNLRIILRPLSESAPAKSQSSAGSSPPVDVNEVVARDTAVDADSPPDNGGVARSGGTNLQGPLLAADDQIADLLGVVMISDGDWNEGGPPVDAATRLRMRGVPIFTVPVGSPRKLPDVEVLDVDVPTFATLGKSVRIPFTLQSSLPREVSLGVTLTTSSGDRISQTIQVAAMGRTTDAILWKPDKKGDHVVTVAIDHHPQDVLPDNDAKSSPIAIREENLRVLVVESYPRWEYRYFRNALSRDPGVDVSCLLFHPDLEAVGGGSTDYIKSFPDTIEELAAYDVVFLGDVGVETGQLTTEQADLLKGLIQYQASGLVLIPGATGRQFSLLQTQLNQLYPVDLDPLQPDGWGSVDAGHFQLSDSGRSSLLTKLADTAEENSLVWESLPGFQWYAPISRSRPGTDTLAVHGEVSNRYGRLPLLVTRTFGSGKVLFMGTDGAWRWRKGVEDKYHYRFWSQVVRWMAYQRNMAKGESMRFYYTPDQPGRRQTMTLTANVIARSGEPLQDGTVVAQITSPGGHVASVRLLPEGESWGMFRGQFVPEQTGQHEVLVQSPQAKADLSTAFFVQGGVAEQIGRPARPEVLEELAILSGGVSVSPDRIDEIVSKLAALPLPQPALRRVQLWCHPVAAAALIVLLAAFWIGRKSAGLI